MSHLYSIDIDGCAFDAAHDEDQPGAANHSRINGPNVGNGFRERTSGLALPSIAEAEASIRILLRVVDPETGMPRSAEEQ
jgi:hypothetical protein